MSGDVEYRGQLSAWRVGDGVGKVNFRNNGNVGVERWNMDVKHFVLFCILLGGGSRLGTCNLEFVAFEN